MVDEPGQTASTPESSKSVAQTESPASDADATHADAAGAASTPARRASEGPKKYPGEGTRYRIGPGVTQAVRGRPYERRRGDPIYRPLRIFTLDPAVSRWEGSVALVRIPYEPLKPGPKGAMFEVDINAGWEGQPHTEVDLDDPRALIQNGRDPSSSDPQFHQQMLYAVCSSVYATFRAALGRHIAWGFQPHRHGSEECSRLRIRPHAARMENAYYDPEPGELRFGFYKPSGKVVGKNPPEGLVFTCLSHDIIAHEVTHALLDGLRTNFTIPSNPDVPAFHEAFADLVALFQHFSYDQVVLAAIGKSRGKLEEAELLTGLARQFGETTESTRQGKALRAAIEDDPQHPRQYNDFATEPHDRGSVLVAAVFAAFLKVYRRKTARYVRLATGGSGILPAAGELSPDLQGVLAEVASKLASQFLAICIRAIDYCPPVDLRFGEFLRAVITADRDLVPDDPWNYREAWIEAFGERGIFPTGVDSLSEDALVWQPPERPLAEIADLAFAELRFDGDPGSPAGEKELRRQAAALGQVLTRPENLKLFGLAATRDPRLADGESVDLSCVHSIRTSRRVGPDGQVLFDLVAEVTQRRTVRAADAEPSGGTIEVLGGSTIILGPRGEIRYVISKGAFNERRLERQRAFMAGKGSGYWTKKADRHVPAGGLFRMLHE